MTEITNPTTAVSDAAPTTIEVGDAASAGVGTEASRSDHQHAVTAPAAPTTAAFADVAAAGAALAVARSDHRHGMPAAPVRAIWAQPHNVVGIGATLSSGNLDYATTDLNSTTVLNSCRWTVPIPTGFVTLLKAVVVVFAVGSTGDLRWEVETDFGATGELMTANADSIATTTQALVSSTITEIDVSAALTAIAAGDYVGLEFIRRGDDVADTISDLQVLGLLIEYR